MVVEQEMAEIYPPDPEGLCEFLPETDCAKCGYSSCMEFAAAILKLEVDAHKCSDLDSEFAQLLNSIAALNKDPIPYNVMMEQAPCTLIEVNAPGENAPLLITCNFRHTVTIMKEILEKTATRAFLLPTFTHGYSVDNAMHEKMFKALEVWKTIQENAVTEKIRHSQLIIPGLAESEKNSIRQLTRWNVLVGPISGFLAPLFLMDNGLWVNKLD
ncbi:MAG: (Fe-S)-binding protein [Desulfobacterales bacterium]|jgi:acetyl-CoA decarbonylase/synthase complex subunit gamma